MTSVMRMFCSPELAMPIVSMGKQYSSNLAPTLLSGAAVLDAEADLGLNRLSFENTQDLFVARHGLANVLDVVRSKFRARVVDAIL